MIKWDWLNHRLETELFMYPSILLTIILVFIKKCWLLKPFNLFCKYIIRKFWSIKKNVHFYNSRLKFVPILMV